MVNAQEAVVGAADADALFVSKYPELNRNKQADQAGKWIGEDYIQHNPLVKNGLPPVVEFFTKTLGRKPTPVPEKMKTEIVSVVAEGDKVIVAYVEPITNSKDTSKSYTTTRFDMWRFKDGKAVEHWDTDTVND